MHILPENRITILIRGAMPRGNAHMGPVTREMVQARTRELALAAGRVPPYIMQVDYEQAKRELTGTSEADQQDVILDLGNEGASPVIEAVGRNFTKGINGPGGEPQVISHANYGD
ncbi:MAG: hypothetical protein ABIQ12_01715 [Opitutaceae bacterium]